MPNSISQTPATVAIYWDPILPRSTTSHSQQSSIYSRAYIEGSDPFCQERRWRRPQMVVRHVGRAAVKGAARMAGALPAGRILSDAECVRRGHQTSPLGAWRRLRKADLHEGRHCGAQVRGQGFLKCDCYKIMAVFSRYPREHWLKPHFSKNEVANSG